MKKSKATVISNRFIAFKAVCLTAYFIVQCLVVAAGGYMIYVRLAEASLSARIFTNVDDHTPMNHGQKEITVTLPKGMSFSSFGGCVPHWKSHKGEEDKRYWEEITCRVEKWDSNIQGYKEAPFVGPGWTEVVP